MSNWSIYPRQDGRWAAQRTVNGKPQYVYGKTRGLVEWKIRQTERVDLPFSFTGSTVSDYLNHWLEVYVKPEVKYRTYEGYKRQIDLHITPVIGGVLLPDLTEAAVRAVLAALLADNKASTARLALSVMKGAFKKAVDLELLARNPAAAVRQPEVEEREAVTLTEEQVKALFNSSTHEPLRVCFLTSAVLGLRAGELRGLRWRDINLRDRTLYVRNQLQRQQGKWALTSTKSKRSKRPLVIPAILRDTLAHHYEDEVARGRGQDDDYVFNLDGKELNASAMRRRFKEMLTRHNLPDIRLHDLRHTCATLLVANNVPMKTVQEILGHANYNITANLYAHVSPKAIDRAADTLDEVLS